MITMENHGPLNLEPIEDHEFSYYFNELKFPRSFSLVSPIISKSHLEKNRIIDKMLRRL